MRRGHPGIGGWRNENPRHFRPRSGGTSYFGSNRPHSLLETPRYPPPGPRPQRPPVFNPPLSANQNDVPDRQERNPYRHSNRYVQRPSDRSHQQFSRGYQHRNVSIQHHDRGHQHSQGHLQSDRGFHHQGRDHQHTQRKNFSFYQNLNENDIDHSVPFYGDRQIINPIHDNIGDQENRHHISPWDNPPNELRQYYDNISIHNKSQRQPESNTENKNMLLTGHRPHSSDYYGSNSAPVIENTSFNRSVDDTVDIVRKRLLNRSDLQNAHLTQSVEDNTKENKNLKESDTYENIQQQPTKKRQQRQKQNTKENCHKIKNKIIHQLFKMDKGKIHKLMDNPNSSTKFEYAISSLITESQNSLNHHLRSVAEKSLSSSDFIQNDNNTIYEDTFMKQMQCILDPQDTVLLEDIKPMVMAELTKVLQLDEFEHRFEMEEPACDENINYEPYLNEPQNYIDFSETAIYEGITSPHYDRSGSAEGNNTSYEVQQIDPKPLFQRRPTRESYDYSHNRTSSTESQQHIRRSRDSKAEEELNPKSPMPLFDGNTEQFSEDEDPFAELDQQYHVEVDHNFLETDGNVSPQQLFTNNRPKPPVANKENPSDLIIQSPAKNKSDVKQEIDAQLQTTATSQLKLNLLTSQNKINVSNIKHEQIECSNLSNNQISFLPQDNTNNNVEKSVETVNLKQEPVPEPKENIAIEKSENSNTIAKSTVSSSSRKRPNDQRPSHRKEKRKKSENTQSDSKKQILNKNIIINVNDCAAKTDKCTETAKSIFNLFFPKDEVDKNVSSKDDKKGDVTDKAYSDKYVKRKETPKKSKDKNSQAKNRTSSSSSHSIVSPKENSTNSNNLTQSKPDAKTKLKTINMFEEQPKKVNVHTSHRNTAITPSLKKTADIENKSKPVVQSVARKVSKRHVSTQIIRKFHTAETQTIQSRNSCTRFCQTETKKYLSKSVQTDTVCFKTLNLKSVDTFERMKEIDLEIQVLLQEKFKLYSSLESKESSVNTMQTLGMTVLNVTPLERTKEDDTLTETLSEDSIVEEFTNIPDEELVQIALETVQEGEHETITESKQQPKQLQEHERNTNTVTTKCNKKKIKTPNISLLEQIITDDRPLEDIVSLDDLENLPINTKKKNRRTPKSRRRKTKKHTKTTISNLIDMYNIKNCCVVLEREDISKYLNLNLEEALEETLSNDKQISIVLDESIEEPVQESSDNQDKTVIEPDNIVEETVVNDIQFDMLDVSEDIVIGDNIEVKSTDDKDIEREEVPVCEEIILDNSQSSCEDTVPTDSGNNGNECKTYDYSSDENLRRDAITVTGNADAVLAIECIENNFVAACLDGNVYYFSGDGQLLSTLRGSNLAVTCLTIVKEKYGTTVYTGSLDSRIRYYDLETGLEKGPECNVLSPIQTMDRAWDTVFVGTRTGFVLQFECKNNMLIPVSTVKFSEQSILALRAMKEGPRKVLLVAARSENVTIKDAQTGLILRTLTGPMMTVYTLLYEDGKVYCGTSSHLIHVFEYTSGCLVGSHEGGKGAVCLRASGGLLFAGCYDGCVYVYREGESRPLAQLRGPSMMLLSLAVVGSKIIAGYKDRSLYIWKIPLSILQEMIL